MKIKFNKNWMPINEAGDISFSKFNKRFPIDMSFKFNTLFKTHRIRFVKHPDLLENEIRVFHNIFPRTWMFWLWKGKKGNRIIDSKKLIEFEETLAIKDAENKYEIKLS